MQNALASAEPLVSFPVELEAVVVVVRAGELPPPAGSLIT